MDTLVRLLVDYKCPPLAIDGISDHAVSFPGLVSI